MKDIKEDNKLMEQLKELAAEAAAKHYNEAAVVLNTLLGAIHSANPKDLSELTWICGNYVISKLNKIQAKLN